MSTTEILDQLPNLTPSDLELVYVRAAELQLKAVFDEADAAFEKEVGVSLAEAQRMLDSWNTK